MASVHAMIHYERDGTALICLEGDIDMHTVPAVHAALDTCEATRVDVDLSAVGFCDASGLNAFLAAHRRLAAQDGGVRFHHPSPAVRRVFDLTGTAFLLAPGRPEPPRVDVSSQGGGAP